MLIATVRRLAPDLHEMSYPWYSDKGMKRIVAVSVPGILLVTLMIAKALAAVKFVPTSVVAMFRSSTSNNATPISSPFASATSNIRKPPLPVHSQVV